MHSDKQPSCLGAGLQQMYLNPSIPEIGVVLWRREGCILWFLNCTLGTLQPRAAPQKYPADKTWHLSLIEEWALPDRCTRVWKKCQFCRHTLHPAQVKPRQGGHPDCRSLAVDPALNNHFPAESLGFHSKCSGNLKKKKKSLFFPFWAREEFLIHPS